jgi:hypothetical protein
MRQKKQKLTSASWLRPVCGGFHNLIRFNCDPFFSRHVADIVSWLLHVLTHAGVRQHARVTNSYNLLFRSNEFLYLSGIWIKTGMEKYKINYMKNILISAENE